MSSDTPTSENLVVTCPSCGKTVSWSEHERWRPFCSQRCRLIDLGAWADESHSIQVHSEHTRDLADE